MRDAAESSNTKIEMVTLLTEQHEDLYTIQQQMLNQQRGGKKHDTRIYWKRPEKNQDGHPDPAPGWILWASDDMKSTRFSEQWITLGWTPLPKYGTVCKFGSAGDVIDLINEGKLPPDCPDKYGPWGRILCHPDGPAEFPVDQILAFKWYDPARCPVPGVVWPQLRGVEIEEFECPECNTVSYAKPVYLARHLRNTHNYDRQEIITLGQELGINFGKELARGRVRKTYSYDEAEFAREVVAAPPAAPVVRKHQPTGRRKTGRGGGGPERGSLEAKLRMARVRAGRAKNKSVTVEPSSE